MSDKPWWWPERADDETVKRLRNDYPEKSLEYESDDELLGYFEYERGQFMDTWDHLGDARSEYAELAEAFIKLVSECGKMPADFNTKEQ